MTHALTRRMALVLAATATVAATTTGAAGAAPVGSDSGAAASTTTAAVAERPLLRVPFDCGRTWRTATGDHHRDADGYYSVDMNWGGGDDDFGSPVLASASGTAYTHRDTGGYGNHVIVRHGGGWSTLYAHLSQINVSNGQSVGPKTVLGKLGGSGNVSSPHLHYAQRLDNVAKPIKFGTSTNLAYPYDTAERIRDCR